LRTNKIASFFGSGTEKPALEFDALGDSSLEYPWACEA
jgi:hypothetical protein